jgi:RNA polymerase sigma-70 factor (ECF subfamily)
MSGEVAAAVALAHRREWARVFAATARLTRDLDLAEECAQDAYAQALQTWPRTGIPDRPGAWLTTAARNRALDVLRRESVLRRTLPLLVPQEPVPGPEDGLDDDRLRLVFTCCHPALSRDAQVALTLRLVCGLSTPEVARAFLVGEATMAARITRAKKKITAARIPYRAPSPEHLTERLGAVLEVVHLIFTTGHTAPIGAHLVRRDLVDSALRLARMLHLLMPRDTDAGPLLGLLLLIDARRETRVSPGGRLLLLSEQDRSRWGRRWWPRRCVPGGRRGTPWRPPSRRYTHRLRRGGTPTGRRSSGCMTSCSRCGPPRSSRSTGRWRWASGTARLPGWRR